MDSQVRLLKEIDKVLFVTSFCDPFKVCGVLDSEESSEDIVHCCIIDFSVI